jgi:hypothetical protein
VRERREGEGEGEREGKGWEGEAKGVRERFFLGSVVTHGHLASHNTSDMAACAASLKVLYEW